MDVWAWIHSKQRELYDAGQGRLAEIMDELPHWISEDEHELAETLYNEGLALARENSEKWVEIFLRHWHMQSQVLGLRNANKLSEVIDLLNLSHQEDTRGCPQRICAVQDLANCYGIKDGPAYFGERIAVAEETLAEINASWSCYCCISVEMIDAYLDVEDYAAALDKVNLAIRELAKVDEDPGELFLMKARALLGLGRADEALEVLQSFSGAGYGLRMHRQAQQVTTLVHIARQDWNEAESDLLSYEDALSASVHFKYWVLIRYKLFQAGRFEVTRDFLRGVREMVRRLESSGAAREALMVAGMLARISMSAGFWFVAEIALESMRNQVPMLAKDLGANEEISELEAQLVATKQSIPPLDDSLTLEAFHTLEFGSEDEALQAYILANARWPDDEGLVVRLATLYEQFGAAEKAVILLREGRDRLPASGPIELAYGRHLLSFYGESEFREACSLDDVGLSPEARVSRLWNYVELYRGQDPQRAVECLGEILTNEPGNPDAIYHRSSLLEVLERHEEAIESWKELIGSYPEDTHLRWRMLVTATLAGHWSLVRETGEGIGFEFEEGLPLDGHNMGIIKIEFLDEHGDIQRCFAQRTGPVTATVVEVSQQGTPQRYGARTVFDPAPLNELSDVDEEGNACDPEGHYHYVYRNIKVVEAPEFSMFTLDGVHPGDEQLIRLKEHLDTFNVVFSLRSSEEYIVQLSSDEGSEDLPGLFAYILVPKGVDLFSVNQCLEAFSGKQLHPLVWPELLEALEDIPALERQSRISSLYNL